MILTVQQIVKQMISAGVHFGHPRYQRNPKMIPYIYTEKDNLQIIDLLQTHNYLQSASFFLFNACRSGKRVLFVGTRKHVAKCIEQTAIECNSWYINKRWLGGLLTNWETMRKSILKIQKEDSNFAKAQTKAQTKSQTKAKKETTRIERQKKRLMKYLGGVKTMSKLPDIVIIVGQRKEMNAVRECQKLKIPSLTILDTNCDPSLTTFFVPANDDSVSSIQLILNRLSKAIQEGQKAQQKSKKSQRKSSSKSIQKQNFHRKVSKHSKNKFPFNKQNSIPLN